MVEKRHREALKANNRMNKYGNCKPPKQKIKITIEEIAVKWENHLSIPKLHNRSSLPAGTPSTGMPSHPSGKISREANRDRCSSLLEEKSDASLSAPASMQHHHHRSERAAAWGTGLEAGPGDIAIYSNSGSPGLGCCGCSCPGRQQQQASLMQIKV